MLVRKTNQGLSQQASATRTSPRSAGLVYWGCKNWCSNLPGTALNTSFNDTRYELPGTRHGTRHVRSTRYDYSYIKKKDVMLVFIWVSKCSSNDMRCRAVPQRTAHWSLSSFFGRRPYCIISCEKVTKFSSNHVDGRAHTWWGSDRYIYSFWLSTFRQREPHNSKGENFR